MIKIIIKYDEISSTFLYSMAGHRFLGVSIINDLHKVTRTPSELGQNFFTLILYIGVVYVHVYVQFMFSLCLCSCSYKNRKISSSMDIIRLKTQFNLFCATFNTS